MSSVWISEGSTDFWSQHSIAKSLSPAPNCRKVTTIRRTTVSDPPPSEPPYAPRPHWTFAINLAHRNRLTTGAAVDDVVPDPVSKKPRGHGTQVSILAAGCKTGVARNANLYLIKMSAALMKEGLIQGVDALPAASLFALRHIRTVISGSVPGVSVPRGKAVLVMSGSWEIDVLKRKYPAIWESMLGQIKTALEDLDRLGVVVAIAAGNGGVQFGPTEDPNFVPTYVDQQFPTVLATPDNPIILVGATNNRGQLSDFTSPGRAAIPISLYAQGEGIRTYDFLSPELKMKLGTSFSAPIVVCPLILESPESVMLTLSGRTGCLHARPGFQPMSVQQQPCCRRRLGGHVHQEIPDQNRISAGGFQQPACRRSIAVQVPHSAEHSRRIQRCQRGHRTRGRWESGCRPNSMLVR